MGLSDDPTTITTFIRGVPGVHNGWNDGEAYEQALYVANKDIAWRAGAQKRLVLVGDDIPHGPDFPGNDHRVDWHTELAGLVSKGVATYAVQCPSLGEWAIAASVSAAATVPPPASFVQASAAPSTSTAPWPAPMIVAPTCSWRSSRQ